MIKIGVICPSEIAYRRFMPALQKIDDIQYVGIAVASKKEWYGEDSNVSDEEYENTIASVKAKAQDFKSNYGGKIYSSYEQLIKSGDIDAIYLPLPPSLHYKWAKMALENNLNVFLEKPSTTCLKDTQTLVEMADEKGLALHENYMFAFHSQLEEVADMVNSGEIGTPRLYRVDFGFPDRGANDFRYIKSMGGGALLDCGGYTLKYANMLLGGNARITTANVEYRDDLEVEIFGAATLVNDTGAMVQVAFGMDNDYRCNLDIWGSKGTIRSNRILTAPDGFVPTMEIAKNGEVKKVEMKADDAFYKSIIKFIECCRDEKVRKNNYEQLLQQEKLVDQFIKMANLE